MYNIGECLILSKKTKKPLLFRILRRILMWVYPQYEIVGLEKLPQEPSVLVGNHSQLHGPVACELYFSDSFYTWCNAQMMNKNEVQAYAYQDFWSQKPKYSRWFYKAVSYLIVPLSVLIFNNARTIPVYHDKRVIKTFKTSLNHLTNGENVIIFPEYDQKHNNILYDFQEGFIDIAKLYYKKTGKQLSFVPLYIAPKLKKMFIGDAIEFSAQNTIEAERVRIKKELMEQITDIATSLPKHTVVPYRNIPKREYPENIKGE